MSVGRKGYYLIEEVWHTVTTYGKGLILNPNWGPISTAKFEIVWFDLINVDVRVRKTNSDQFELTLSKQSMTNTNALNH